MGCYYQVLGEPGLVALRLEGLEKIKNLQSLDSNEISEKAVKILKTYYLLENEDETLPPGNDQRRGDANYLPDDKSQKLKSTIQFQKFLPTEDSPLADKIIETFKQLLCMMMQAVIEVGLIASLVNLLFEKHHTL
ncbi:unnamed protein product [Trifolium pratense]|uniref:Uncharacterized protein n=1 Tax=Trifolium pratense TaxID=57577 RepID=A0ACB0IS44_TRIPR|nr:unnamed protein product [Trifolium pratense]